MVTFEVSHQADNSAGQEGLSAVRRGGGAASLLWPIDVCPRALTHVCVCARVCVSTCVHEHVREGLCLRSVGGARHTCTHRIPTRHPAQ